MIVHVTRRWTQFVKLTLSKLTGKRKMVLIDAVAWIMFSYPVQVLIDGR